MNSRLAVKFLEAFIAAHRRGEQIEQLVQLAEISLEFGAQAETNAVEAAEKRGYERGRAEYREPVIVTYGADSVGGSGVHNVAGYLPLESMEAIRDALRDHRKIDAIKRIRSDFRLSLKDGKEAVEEIERQMNYTPLCVAKWSKQDDTD